jgi:hypothetical protein
MRRIIGVLAVGVTTLALAACQPPEDKTGKAGAQAPACRAQDLALKRGGEDALTSTVSYRFENHGAGVCSLKGYATITLTGADGAALDADVQHFAPPPGPSRREPKVVLRPGASADFNVVFPKDAGKGACKPYVKLTATPPGSDWGLDVAQVAKLCPGTMLVSTFMVDASEL